jgi:regulator of sigma E protease
VPHFIPEIFRTVGAFAVVLGVLVFFHELGHYAAARWRGVFVEAFSIGFGGAIASWRDRRGTQWRLSVLPLGGYVKLHGQERPEDVPPEVRATWRKGETFHEKPVGSRAIIVAAGPAANFVLAMVLFAGLFIAVGRPITEPVVGEVLPNEPAARAGLMVKDKIVAIDGQPIRTFEDIQRIVTARPDQKLAVTVSRAGARKDLTVLTATRTVHGHQIGLLGIRGGAIAYQPVSVPAALWGGVAQTWTVTSETISGLGQIIAGERGTDELGGPLRIAQLSGEVAQSGVTNLLMLIAVLSINLGLINLFPIPVLDGGHLLFYLVEAVAGHPLPRRAQEYGFRAGIAVLAGLFIFATWNDLAHIGLFHWVAGLMG